MPKIWIFSNLSKLDDETSDFTTQNILKSKKYYFKQSERNRAKVSKGDKIILREYGTGFWGTCEISGDWTEDQNGIKRYGVETGWFPISNIKKWKNSLPYEVIRSELSNQNYRLRIAKANEDDKNKIELALRIYRNMGYGEIDGNFFILESGIEEAVKANLSQLGLELAEKEIQQQCALEIGVGRTDLICRDKEYNYVVLELKAIHSSDNVVGQILRYMGYIREKWAEKEKKDVKGIILIPSYDEQLRLAAKEAGIRVLRLRIL